jgi:hypothetical protein
MSKVTIAQDAAGTKHVVFHGENGTLELTPKEARHLANDLNQAAKAIVLPRSPDLTKAAETICFEMFHLRYYADLYTKTKGKGRRFRTVYGERIGQAFEYSLLLHLRVLLDFFFKEPKGDDVGVSDFDALPGFDQAFPATLRKASNGVWTVSNHLNKRLAHFCEFRWKNGDHKGMDFYEQYWQPLLGLIDAFEKALSGIPHQKYHDRLKKFQENCDEQKFLK